MGLNIDGSNFLLAQKRRGLELGKILTLGRQETYMPEYQYTRLLKDLGTERTTPKYGDDFFLALGAESLDVMDASSYEGAGVIHDLNEPIDPDYHATYDTVLDGGTLEHVFHFPNAIRSCMSIVKPGGNLILMTPWHNYAGHGLYQFSPELFYNILSPINGYIIESMMIVADGYWYSIKNPKDIHHRIEISTPSQINLYIIAKRVNSSELFKTWPQQSDYAATWIEDQNKQVDDESSKSFKNFITSQVPAIEKIQYHWRRYKGNRLQSPSRNVGMQRLCKSHEIPYL